MGPVKLPFTESDLTPLVKRYSSSTIVTMLREIARCKTSKLDWVMLCKRTSTGITNPKEFQALWRSIAYRAELDDSYDENNDSPLEDDSDLEVELDPVPSVSSAVAESIASYVKSDLQQQELEDARSEQTAVVRAAADHSSAKLQQSAATQGESAAAAATTPLTCSTSTKVPYSGSLNNQADRKRRRLWTPEEDLALIAAVDKCGEGNWTTVLKNHYDFDRTASQLSQRWALIRKRREVQEKAGYGIGSGVSPLASGYKDLRGPESALKSTSVTVAAAAGTPSGSQLGTGKAAAAAGTVATPIKQPVSSTTPSPVPVSKRIPAPPAASGVSQRPAPATTMRVTPGQQQQQQQQVQHKQQPRPAAAAPMPAAPRGVARGGPDPMIQAAAMAAGARIAPAATAASLLKAAQSGNVVHIGSGGLPRSKLGQPSSGNNSGIVHYIRTGSGGASLAARGPPHHLAKNQSNRGSFNSGNSSPLSAPTVPVRNNVQASKPARGSSPQQKTAPVVSTTKAASSSPAVNSSSSPALKAAVAPVIKATSTPVSVSTTSKPVAALASTKSAPASMSVANPARPTPASAPAPASTRPTTKTVPASTPASLKATPVSGPASSRPTPASTKPTPASASVSTKPTPPLAKPAPALAKPAPASTKPTPASITRPAPESSKPTPAPKPVATSMACGFNTAGSPGDGTT